MSVRRANGDGTAAAQRKDGIWYRSIVIDGKRRYVYGKTETEVNKKFRELKNEKPEVVAKAVKRMTVEEYMTEWLTVYKKLELKPKSYDTLECSLRYQIFPYFKGRQFFSITNNEIQKFINTLNKEGYSYSVIRKAYLALNACFKHAITKDNLEKNPCMLIKLPKKAEKNIKSIQVLSEDEIRRYCNAATKCYSNGKAVYRLGYGLILILFTGLRLGEAGGLMWEDIDFEKRTLRVQRSLEYVKNREWEEGDSKYVLVEGSTKSRSSERTIPLNQTALNALLELQKITGRFPYVFSHNSGKPMNPRNLNRIHSRVLESAGIKRIGIHALRHTFATQLFAQKVDVKIISKLLGHSEVSITYNVYIHLMQEELPEATDSLDGIWNKE